VSNYELGKVERKVRFRDKERGMMRTTVQRHRNEKWLEHVGEDAERKLKCDEKQGKKRPKGFIRASRRVGSGKKRRRHGEYTSGFQGT